MSANSARMDHLIQRALKGISVSYDRWIQLRHVSIGRTLAGKLEHMSHPKAIALETHQQQERLVRLFAGLSLIIFFQAFMSS